MHTFIQFTLIFSKQKSTFIRQTTHIETYTKSIITTGSVFLLTATMSGLVQQEHLFAYGSPLVSEDDDDEICFDSNGGYSSSSEGLYTSDGIITEDEGKMAETALDILPYSRYMDSRLEVSSYNITVLNTLINAMLLGLY